MGSEIKKGEGRRNIGGRMYIERKIIMKEKEIV